MAEIASNTAIVPAESVPQEYLIEVKDYDAAGRLSKFAVPVPTNFTSREASIMLRAAILKQTTHKAASFPQLMHLVMYADDHKLNAISGDVYLSPDGRIATTAGAKIKHAMGSGKIAGYTVNITEGPAIKLAYQLKGEKQEYSGPNLKARVEVRVHGWEVPVVYETTLAEWFMGTNPNWRTRPAYMLRRNALSKALEEVAPIGIDTDEAPPLTTEPVKESK